jgi:hypothetical protein
MRLSVAIAVLATRSAKAFREDLSINVAATPVDLDGPDAPRNVYVAVGAVKAGSIEPIPGTFLFDIYLYVAWRDDRQERGSFQPDDTVWWPRPEIMNWHTGEKGQYLCSFSRGSPPFTLLNLDGTWGTCQARHHAYLDVTLGMHNFPFDKQAVSVILESFLWPESKLRFVALPTVDAGLVPPGGVAGWTVLGTLTGGEIHKYTVLGESYHRLVLTLKLQRLPDYYLSRYVLGVVLLVAMGFLALTIPGIEPERFVCCAVAAMRLSRPCFSAPVTALCLIRSAAYAGAASRPPCRMPF